MNIEKVALLTLVSVALAACGGGGGGTPSTASTETNGSGSASSGGSAGTGTQTVSDAEVKAEKTLSVDATKAFVDARLAELEKDLSPASDYKVTINGKSYSSGVVDLSSLGEGMKRLPVTETGRVTQYGETYEFIANSTAHLYQQPYSIVAGSTYNNVGNRYVGEKDYDNRSLDDDLTIDIVKGYTTKTLPKEGSFSYKGTAFTKDETGKLSYNVDFSSKVGSGSIEGISQAGTITLNQGTISEMKNVNDDGTSISGFGIEANAQSTLAGNGSYRLGFFGPNAEEIAGAVKNAVGDAVVGFGGKR